MWWHLIYAGLGFNVPFASILWPCWHSGQGILAVLTHSYLSQLFWTCQLFLFDFAPPTPTLSFPGRIRLFKVWLSLYFSLVQRNCFVLTARNASCSLSGIPINRFHSRNCNILGFCLYHIEKKAGPGKAKFLWCQTMAKPEIKLEHISACLIPSFCLAFLLSSYFSFVISSYHQEESILNLLSYVEGLLWQTLGGL